MKSSIDLGVQAFKDGRFSDAITFLESSTKFHPDNYKLWLMLARAYHKDLQYDKALEAYQSVCIGATEDELLNVARQGLDAVRQEMKAAQNRPKELFCPECGTSIPAARHGSPWCLCGWSQKGAKVTHSSFIYLKDVQAYCHRNRIKIYLKRKNDIFVIQEDRVELQGLGTKTFPVDARLAFPLKERLAFMAQEELIPILPKVNNDALFRERNSLDNSTMGRLYNWGTFLARLSEGLGFDVTLRVPDISVGGVLVAYGYVSQQDLDLALTERIQGETIGQTLVRLGICSLDTIIEGVVGRSRLGSVCTRNPNQRLGAILLAEGIIDERQLKQALFFQSQMARPIGELLIQLRFCTEDQIKAALRKQRPVKAELAEADYLGEVLVQQGQLTRTDLIQALSEEQEQIKRPLGEILASMNWCNPKSIKRALGWQAEKKRLLAEGVVRLGQVLIDLKFISSDILGQVLSEQVSNPKPLGWLLVEKGYCTPEQILAGLEEQINRRNRMAWQGDQGDDQEVKVISKAQINKVKKDAVKKKVQAEKAKKPKPPLVPIVAAGIAILVLIVGVSQGVKMAGKQLKPKPKPTPVVHTRF